MVDNNTLRHYRNVKDFKALPSGLENTLLEKYISEFRNKDFTHSDIFIEAYTRFTIYRSLKYVRNASQTEDLMSVGLLALSKVPIEVSEGRFHEDGSILKYISNRVKSACVNYCRHDYTLQYSHHIYFKTGQSFKQNNIDLSELRVGDKSNLSTDLLDFINSLVETEGERLVIIYRLEGYTDREIANKLGLSESKVNKIKLGLARKFEDVKELFYE